MVAEVQLIASKWDYLHKLKGFQEIFPNYSYAGK